MLSGRVLNDCHMYIVSELLLPRWLYAMSNEGF